MKYDDSEYCFLNFETELDNDAASTHIGMFLAWCVLRGLGREDAADERWSQAVARLKRREITAGELLIDMCDGKLMDLDLSAEGNAFAGAYYESRFIKDYETVLRDQMPSTGHDTDDFCSVPDTWANFDRLAPLLDKRYGDWKGGPGPAGSPGPKPSGGAAPLELSLEPLEGEVANAAASATAGGGLPASTTVPPTGEALAFLQALQQRATAGDGEAWYELGAEYITGERTPRDFTKAANAFEKAAQLGIAQAAFNLAVCYQNGDGRPQDPKQMLRWFALAAEGGHGESAYFLAMAYRQGQHLQRDFVASNALMMIARSRGVKAAAEAGVMAGSAGQTAALVSRLIEPGQFVATLSARRRALAAGKVDDGTQGWVDPAGPEGAAGGAAGGTAGGSAGGGSVGRSGTGVGGASATASGQASGGSSRAASGRSSTSSRSAVTSRSRGEAKAGGIGFGAVALIIGAVALVPLLLAGPSLAGGRFKALATALSLVGAVGVFVVSGGLRASLAMRVVLTVLAAVPFLGSFACMAVTWAWARSRRNSA